MNQFGAGVPEPGTGQIHLSPSLESRNRKPVVLTGLEGSNPSPGAIPKIQCCDFIMEIRLLTLCVSCQTKEFSRISFQLSFFSDIWVARLVMKGRLSVDGQSLFPSS